MYMGVKGGKKVFESVTRPTKKEAEYAALELELHHKDVTRDSSALYLSEAMQMYIDDRRAILSPSTINGYDKMRRLYFQTLQTIPLKKITQQHVQREIDHLAKTLSPKTVANAHGFLNAVFSEYHPNMILRTKLPKKQKFQPSIPDAALITQIFSAVKNTDIEIPVHLAIWLGLRMSEIRALRFSNVYDDRIVIDSAIVDVKGDAVEKQTKTFAGTRMIPAPKKLVDMIRSVPHETPTDFVTPMTGQAIYKRFTRILEANEIPHCRFHDLRHANASVMLLLGVPDKYAMERLGHATNSTLKNVYQHTMVAEKVDIADRINAYFDSLDNIAESDVATKGDTD